MINKIYDITNAACEKANKSTGIKIKFPKPSKFSLKISAISNGLIGIGLLCFGLLTPHKQALSLGVLGILGSLIVGKELKK